MPTVSARAEQRRGSHLVFQLFYGRTLAWIDDMQGRFHLNCGTCSTVERPWRFGVGATSWATSRQGRPQADAKLDKKVTAMLSLSSPLLSTGAPRTWVLIPPKM